MLRGFTPLTARGERNFGTQLPAALRLWISTGHSLLLVPWRIIVPPGWRVRSSSARTFDRWSGATYSSTLLQRIASNVLLPKGNALVSVRCKNLQFLLPNRAAFTLARAITLAPVSIQLRVLPVSRRRSTLRRCCSQIQELVSRLLV